MRDRCRCRTVAEIDPSTTARIPELPTTRAPRGYYLSASHTSNRVSQGRRSWMTKLHLPIPPTAASGHGKQSLFPTLCRTAGGTVTVGSSPARPEAKRQVSSFSSRGPLRAPECAEHPEALLWPGPCRHVVSRGPRIRFETVSCSLGFADPTAHCLSWMPSLCVQLKRRQPQRRSASVAGLWGPRRSLR